MKCEECGGWFGGREGEKHSVTNQQTASCSAQYSEHDFNISQWFQLWIPFWLLVQKDFLSLRFVWLWWSFGAKFNLNRMTNKAVRRLLLRELSKHESHKAVLSIFDWYSWGSMGIARAFWRESCYYQQHLEATSNCTSQLPSPRPTCWELFPPPNYPHIFFIRHRSRIIIKKEQQTF